MENSGILKIKLWPKGRLGFVIGFVVGALITLAVWGFTSSSYSITSVEIHEASTQLWGSLSTPGLVVAQMLSLEWYSPNAEQIPHVILILIIVTNGLVLGGIGAFCGWSYSKIQQLLMFQDIKVAEYPGRTCFSHGLQLAKVTTSGFVIGFLLTFANYGVICAFRGESLVGLWATFLFGVAFIPMRLIATIVGTPWSASQELTIGIAALTSLTNGLLFALIAGTVRAIYDHLNSRRKKADPNRNAPPH